MKVLIVFGTRPEAIKLAPLVQALAATEGVESRVCVTAQHREMLDQVLALFAIEPDYDLDIMRKAQSLSYITARVLEGLDPILAEFKPDWLLVQGDTTTTFTASLCAFYHRIRVGHVEAGLRTWNFDAPWPEEMNRVLTTRLATLHFAPTRTSRENLLREGIDPTRILVTGNTVIDALLHVEAKIGAEPALADSLAAQFPFLPADKRIVLNTGHRRESFDHGLANVFRALGQLADRGDVVVVFPVHLNPRVQAAAETELRGRSNVYLIPPQEYLPFVYLMSRSRLIITDSGGIQEEGPSLGKPILLTREITERPEAVDAGTVEIVGTDTNRIVERASMLLDDEEAYAIISRAHNPYGDGHACERIVARLISEGSAD